MELNLQQNNMNKNKKEKMIDKKVIRFNLKKKMNLLENKFELLINQIKGINKRISTIEEEMEHKNNSKEVQEIIKVQPIMDEIIVANSDAIKIIKSEVKISNRIILSLPFPSLLPLDLFLPSFTG